MKNITKLRKMDTLGRIVVPMDTRKRLGIDEGDLLEVFENEGMICFKKVYTRDICISMLTTLAEEMDKVGSGINNAYNAKQKIQEAIDLLREGDNIEQDQQQNNPNVRRTPW